MMPRLFIPKFVKEALQLAGLDRPPLEALQSIRQNLENRTSTSPEVSIIIPAYNEEKSLPATLFSLSRQQTGFSYEIIVVNNNSTDATGFISEAAGVKNLFEQRQGISYTRQTGFENATGTYILSADADSIYPPYWVETMVKALQPAGTACVYGSYSFVPTPPHTRLHLFFHECISRLLFALRRRNKGYLNVMGFNFGFKKADGTAVGGFNTQRQKWQDGWMGMQLSTLGRLVYVSAAGGCVWTGDRRLVIDGGFWKSLYKRFKKESTRLWEYLKF